MLSPSCLLAQICNLGSNLNNLLSFWAMFTVENAPACSEQITFIDLGSDTDRSAWFKRKTSPSERLVVRALLFGGPGPPAVSSPIAVTSRNNKQNTSAPCRTATA